MKYAVAVLLLLLAFVAVRAHRSGAEYERLLAEAADTVEALTAAAETHATSAAESRVRADLSAARADSAERVADAIRASVEARIAALAPVPPVAVPFTEPRDAIIAELQAENDALRKASIARAEEAGDLRAAYGDLSVAYTHAQTGVRLLEDAIAARPGRQWWRPRTGVGVFGGICTSGPCVGVGVSLDIDIPFL